MRDELLSPETVLDHLRRRGLLAQSDSPEVSVLSGGVSNVAIAAGGLVVKQALETLRVATPWTASPRRVLAEAAALRALSRLTPDAVPRVLDVDDHSLSLVIERAPLGWTDWRSELLSGRTDRAVARRLGQVLGIWHRSTAAVTVPDGSDDGAETFEALRVDPFYRTLARAVPEVAEDVTALVERMCSTRTSLVHGDFSPKNVLVEPGGPGVWVIDLEVAHRGDPVFDLALLLTHLQLKALVRPAAAASYDTLAADVAASYRSTWPDAAWEEPYLVRHIGALVMARVHGKSPADYLDDVRRREADLLGRALLTGEVAVLGDIAAARRRVAP